MGPKDPSVKELDIILKELHSTGADVQAQKQYFRFKREQKLWDINEHRRKHLQLQLTAALKAGDLAKSHIGVLELELDCVTNTANEALVAMASAPEPQQESSADPMHQADRQLENRGFSPLRSQRTDQRSDPQQADSNSAGQTESAMEVTDSGIQPVSLPGLQDMSGVAVFAPNTAFAERMREIVSRGGKPPPERKFNPNAGKKDGK